MMPVLHVVIMLVLLALLAIFAAGVSWLHVTGTLAIALLIIIAVYRPRV